MTRLATCAALVGTIAAHGDVPDAATVVLIVGAGGTPEFGAQFAEWAGRWEAAAAEGGAALSRVGPGLPSEDERTDRDRLRAVLAAVEPGGAAPLWIVFLGHGTFDGADAKLNLRGPDVTARELAGWIDPVQRPTAVVVCAASSAPFVNRLSGRGRVVVAATKSGQQYSYSRFGDHLSAALADPDADLDKDDQISLLEAFLFASAGVAEFYESEARLATEHAIIDDNGDALGTPAAWFRGVRSTREPEGGLLTDGVHAHQLHLVPSAGERAMPAALRAERDGIELRLEELRATKGELEIEEYEARLEALCLELARLYERAGD